MQKKKLRLGTKPLARLTLTCGLAMLPWQSLALAQEVIQADLDRQNESVLTTDQGYILGGGDRIGINVLGIAEYSGEYQISADGTVDLPVVGQLLVRGLTVQQTTEAVALKYRQYVKRPIVTLNLLEARPIRIAIAGEVNRPGSYTIPRTDDNNYQIGVPTVTEVVQLAGGITQSANIRAVQITRPQPRNLGLPQKTEVNLWQLLTTGDASQDITLRDGDTVMIPTAEALDSSESTTLATASFSPAQITVNVVGEVATPGAIAVPPNTPLNQALLAAGGFNNRAAKGSVELVRLNSNGSVSRQKIVVDLAQGLNEGTNPPLRSNDTVIVGRSGLARFTDTAGALFSPLGGVLNLIRFLGF